jgi:hypothetical protein
MNDSLLYAAPLMIAAIVMAVRFVGCGLAGSTGNGNGVVVSVTGDVSGRGSLSATASFPKTSRRHRNTPPRARMPTRSHIGVPPSTSSCSGPAAAAPTAGSITGSAAAPAVGKLRPSNAIPTSLGLQHPSALRSARAGPRRSHRRLGDGRRRHDGHLGLLVRADDGDRVRWRRGGQLQRSNRRRPEPRFAIDRRRDADQRNFAAGSDVISEGGAGADGAAVLVARQQK